MTAEVSSGALTDARLAAQLAVEAGELLMELRRSAAATGSPEGKELRDEGDRRAHRYLLGELNRRRPQDVVFSEEAADPRERLAADRVWIVDPLDGTREFGEHGREDWAVHVALWERGELTVGAVSLPAIGEVYASDEPPVVPEPAPEVPVLLVSRSRPPAWGEDLARVIGGEVRPLGSAGAKVAAVWRGTAQAYVHVGGQYEWDSAAPVAVALAAGLHCSRIDGSPLRYNETDPYLPDLLVCRPELAGPILAWTTDHLTADR